MRDNKPAGSAPRSTKIPWKIDDPWGISWRAANLLKRFSIRRSMRFLSGYIRGIRYLRPVFIIGAPRSGTTLFFHLLRENKELGGLPTEGHNIWRAFHHPRTSGWRSDAVGAGQVRFGERRYVNASFYAYGVSPPRFVEKTPENSLRVPYLMDLFPDAYFIAIRRNPCDVISSLIDGWRRGDLFRSYFVPEDLAIPGSQGSKAWRFVLFDGWRDFRQGPIPEIAFQQWRACTLGLASARELVPDGQWLDVHLETFLEEPERGLERICRHIEIERTQRLLEDLRQRVENPVFALSPPGKAKWRRRNSAEIEPYLSKIAALQADSGYRVDPKTGDFEIVPPSVRRSQ